jgi:hypothetical protein
MDLTTFEKYKEAVLQAYEKKKHDGSLPHNLLHHTVANLRNECVNEFPGRYLDKDNNTFRTFLPPASSKEEYLHKLNLADPNIFKPLNNVLKRETVKGTARINIELLAWLLDLEWRPFKPLDPYYVTPPVEEPLPSNTNQRPLPEPIPWKPEHTDVELSKMARLRNKFLLICKPIKDRPKSFLAGLVIMTSILLLYFLTKPQKMYWNRYQYNTVAFYQNVDGAFFVPLDTFKLAHQKKLLDWSLITRNSIGIVHYSKINGKVEFYTTGGTNPEDTTRRLLPLTEYMFEKYIANKAKNN